MDNKDRPVLIYTTFETMDQARSVGGSLVDSRLAACVNILPGMTSIFEWQGARNEASEVVMIIKTRSGRLDDALEHAKSTHPYNTPALIVIDPLRVDGDFAAWIDLQTGGSG